jgi:signal-transduction protein with cAMP-binding, CBS, and nucleotidyltransferase domain
MTAEAQLAMLRSISPFDRMVEDELAFLLAFADVRDHPPGAIVHRGIAASPRLQIVLAGAVREPCGAETGPVIGLAAMYAEPSPIILLADAIAGATLLSIDRQTFFTLARARPELVRGFLETGPAGARSVTPKSDRSGTSHL